MRILLTDDDSNTLGVIELDDDGLAELITNGSVRVYPGSLSKPVVIEGAYELLALMQKLVMTAMRT